MLWHRRIVMQDEELAKKKSYCRMKGISHLVYFAYPMYVFVANMQTSSFLVQWLEILYL